MRDDRLQWHKVEIGDSVAMICTSNDSEVRGKVLAKRSASESGGRIRGFIDVQPEPDGDFTTYEADTSDPEDGHTYWYVQETGPGFGFLYAVQAYVDRISNWTRVRDELGAGDDDEIAEWIEMAFK